MLSRCIREVATLPSPTDDEESVRAFIVEYLSANQIEAEVDDVGNVWVKRGKIVFCAHMDKLGEPGTWEELGGKIRGRLDDAVGVAIVLTLLKERADASALFTVGEEWSEARKSFGYGASKGVDRLRAFAPDLIVVIDMSPLCVSSEGPILYRASGDATFKPALTDRLVEIAKDKEIPLQITEGRGNDSCVFGLNGLPVFALEAHIENYHTEREVAAMRDIELLYSLCLSIAEEF